MSATRIDRPSDRAARTKPREIRKRQLIEATIDSIAENGLGGTTLTTLTKIANLSHGIVNFHFKSKELLLIETIGHLAGEHDEVWQETVSQSDSTPAARLAALIDTNFHPKICNRRKLTVWFAFYGDPKYRRLYREKCAHIDDARLAETEQLCRRLKLESPGATVEPEMFAQTLEAFIDGLWLNMLLYPKAFSRARAREECLAYLALTFPGHFQALVKTEDRAS